MSDVVLVSWGTGRVHALLGLSTWCGLFPGEGRHSWEGFTEDVDCQRCRYSIQQATSLGAAPKDGSSP